MDADCSNSCIWRAGRRNDPALQDKENSATALTAASMERKRLNSKCGYNIYRCAAVDKRDSYIDAASTGKNKYCTAPKPRQNLHVFWPFRYRRISCCLPDCNNRACGL
eukprot:12061496-Heterocapsa_arctica.AAC.1